MDLYTSYALLMVIETQQVIPKYWTGFFPRMFFSTKDEIAIDKVSNNYKRLAPFVAPNVQGRVLRKRGGMTVSFAPAYVKPKDVLDPSTDLIRQAGETLGSGSLTPMQRRDAVAAWLIERQRIIIDNRIEWMCLQAAVYAKVTISGEDYPTVTVDFRRDASLTVTLAGAAAWDQATATPATNIMDLRIAIEAKSGNIINRVTFGRGAWGNFYAKEIAGKETLLQNNNQRGSSTAISFLSNGFEGAEYMGTYRGSNGAGFDCWVYSAKYENDAETLVDMLNPDAVALVDGGMDGVQAYGAIRDLKAGLQPIKYFPKNWQVEDPSEEYIMTQSAPLMIPGQPDATGMIQTR